MINHTDCLQPKSVIICCQPIYGPIPPKADAEQKNFLTYNVGMGHIGGYLSRVNGYIDWARNQLIKQVLEECPQATHVFFLDQDMILPLPTIAKLLETPTDVISATYFGKDEKATLVAWQSLDPSERLQSFDATAVQRVAGVGMGACLITTGLLRSMAEKFGDAEWFRSERNGEDYHFCKRCQTMDVPILLDGRIHCGHMLDAMVTYQHWVAARGAV